MNFGNLFRMDYWFNQPFSAQGATFWIFVIFFLILILGGIVLRIICSYSKEKTDKKIMHRFSSFGMTMGFFGIVWLFFRQERATFLAWRFWLLLWSFISIWWLAKILEYIVKRVPEIKKAKEEINIKNRYIKNNY